MNQKNNYNPNQWKKKTPNVLTVGGTTEPLANCRRIDKGYYLINRDCFEINNKWHRVEHLHFDHETKKYVTTKKGMINGIVAISPTGELEFGNFSPNPYTNVYFYTGGHAYPVQDKKIFNAFPGIYYREKGTDKYYKTAEQSNTAQILHKSPHSTITFTDKGYNIEDNADEFAEKIVLYNEAPIELSKDVQAYARFIKGLTFGIELEMHKGNLANTDQNRFGVVFCRDGSTSSAGELVTVPMTGAKGLQTLSDLGDVAVQDMIPDITCSYHIHFGGVPVTRSYLVSLYTLCEKLQEEIFTMFPYYKGNPQGFKKKNYCQKLQPKFPSYVGNIAHMRNFKDYLTMAYNQLFNFLSDGNPACELHNAKVKKHPVEHKWNRSSRYFWCNLQNLLFSNRQTAEFRLHQPTMNPQKIINWLFMCAAIVKFAENNQGLVMSSEAISVAKVLNYYKETFPASKRAAFLSNYLIAYFKSRQADMAKDIAKGDRSGERDLVNDAAYTFTYMGKTRLF